MMQKVYFSNAGVPSLGLTPNWAYLFNAQTTTPISNLPPIYEIGGGWYSFDAGSSVPMVGVIDGGITLTGPDRYKPMEVYIGASSIFGSISLTITASDPINSIPIADVEIVLLNQDESVIVNSGLTNSMGVFSAQVHPGVYQARIRKDGWNFTTPITITVPFNSTSYNVPVNGTNVGDVQADFRTLVIPRDIQY